MISINDMLPMLNVRGCSTLYRWLEWCVVNGTGIDCTVPILEIHFIEVNMMEY